MRKLAIIIAVFLQVAVLAYMAGHREYILRTGRIVFLKTAPVDPRDIFRGDYVRLRYEISTVKGDLLQDGLGDSYKKSELGLFKLYQSKEWQKIRSKPVYGLLSVGVNDIADLVSLTDKKPSEGLFIRGHIEHPSEFFDSLSVRYGIEAYFIEQGKGKEIEKTMFQSMRIPLEMEVVIGKNGTSVLKGYRWSPLGISIEEDMNEISVANDVNEASVKKSKGVAKKLKGIRVKLLNNSNKPIGIIDLPDGQSFTLEPQGMFGVSAAMKEKDYKWVGADKELKKVEDSDVRILEPGKTHECYIDISQPQWFVARGGEQAKSISSAFCQFRLVYRPPSPEECKDLQNADLIWHGSLESPAFRGMEFNLLYDRINR
jgi:uncharacterized membrane-anchored protein